MKRAGRRELERLGAAVALAMVAMGCSTQTPSPEAPPPSTESASSPSTNTSATHDGAVRAYRQRNPDARCGEAPLSLGVREHPPPNWAWRVRDERTRPRYGERELVSDRIEGLLRRIRQSGATPRLRFLLADAYFESAISAELHIVELVVRSEQTPGAPLPHDEICRDEAARLQWLHLAIEQYQAIVEETQGEKRAEALYFLGLTQEEAEMPSRAAQHYRRLVEEHPGSPLVPSARLGIVYSAWDAPLAERSSLAEEQLVPLLHHDAVASNLRALAGYVVALLRLMSKRCDEAPQAFAITLEHSGKDFVESRKHLKKDWQALLEKSGCPSTSE